MNVFFISCIWHSQTPCRDAKVAPESLVAKIWRVRLRSQRKCSGSVQLSGCNAEHLGLHSQDSVLSLTCSWVTGHGPLSGPAWNGAVTQHLTPKLNFTLGSCDSGSPSKDATVLTRSQKTSNNWDHRASPSPWTDHLRYCQKSRAELSCVCEGSEHTEGNSSYALFLSFRD